MKNELLLYSCLILFGTFISQFSQVALKKSALKPHKSFWAEYLNPAVIGSYCVFFLATLCSVFAYKVVPLSMGPILESTGYIYGTIFGVTVFKEKMTKRKILALGLILCGIAVYSIFG